MTTATRLLCRTEMSEHPARWETAKLLAECEVRRQRRSGPGGQHRNKVETAVVITHVPTGIQGEASERRSQEQNRRMAVYRLRVNLALEARHAVDTPNSGPSQLWQQRCRHRQMTIRRDHVDFPAILAEALDVLQMHDMDVRRAAAWLGCTSSQLTRLLKLEPRALAHVNQIRRQRDLRPLK